MSLNFQLLMSPSRVWSAQQFGGALPLVFRLDAVGSASLKSHSVEPRFPVASRYTYKVLRVEPRSGDGPKRGKNQDDPIGVAGTCMLRLAAC